MFIKLVFLKKKHALSFLVHFINFMKEGKRSTSFNGEVTLKGIWVNILPNILLHHICSQCTLLLAPENIRKP